MGGRLLEAHFQAQKQAGEAKLSSRLDEVLVHGCLVLGFDKQAVFGQVANEGMVFGELKMGLNGGSVEQGTHFAQPDHFPGRWKREWESLVFDPRRKSRPAATHGNKSGAYDL